MRRPPRSSSPAQIPREASSALVDDRDRLAPVEAEAAPPPHREAAGTGPRLHTLGAGRTLVAAIRADLAGFARHVGLLLRSATATLQRGRALREDATQDRLADGRHARASRLRRGAVALLMSAGIATLLVAVVLTGGILWALHDTPVIGDPARSDRPSLVLESADGRPLGRIGPLFDAVTKRSDFPDLLVNAVLAIEDRRFYRHLGVDPLGILRAARANYAAGEIVEGGSTITQQLVKLRLVGRERTMDRKLREAFAALWLDFRREKDDILTDYLNTIYLGAGAHGVSAAARIYFGKRLSELSVAEAAMIAGLIKAPSVYNPFRNPEAARERAAQVIDAMVETGAIDGATAAAAKAAPAAVRTTADIAPATSWFADWIAKHEVPKVPAVETRSMKVRTTLVPELQQAAERVVAEAFKVPRRGGPTQLALVAMRPDGAVVAMVGGRDYDRSQFNRAADARRQPGSAFKLFVYLAALRAGYSPGDVVDASPIRIKRWEPENFGGRRYGSMLLAQAFAQSVNTAAVRLATEVGLDKVVAAARDLGIDAPLPAVPSLALGTAEVTLVDLTGAFASVRAGRRVDPYGILALGSESQGLRTLGAPSGGALLAHGEALTALLRGVVESGTGRGADVGGFVAGKTGTSQDHRDAWFIGFNETLVVGVWVGNDDHSPMHGVTGGSMPALVWRRFVEYAGAAEANIAARSRPPVAATSATDGRASVDDVASLGAATSDAPLCDVEACADAFSTFRASDCTYSRRGRRRLCPILPRSGGGPDQGLAQTPAGPLCNIELCSRRYRSFDPADCTYQPYRGPRRLCDR